MSLADGLLLLLTAASLVVAVKAHARAREASEAAASAVLVAKDANGIAKTANKIATDSNAIAEGAAQDARDAPTSVAWDEYVTALAALQSFDPAGSEEDAKPVLTALRTRATLLVDRLPGAAFGDWLGAEHTSGILLMQEAAERGERERKRLGRRLTAEERLGLDTHFHLWVAALTGNVRVCRREGLDQTPLERLTEEAWQRIKAVCARNGWPVPTGLIEGLGPLDPPDA